MKGCQNRAMRQCCIWSVKLYHTKLSASHKHNFGYGLWLNFEALYCIVSLEILLWRQRTTWVLAIPPFHYPSRWTQTSEALPHLLMMLHHEVNTLHDRFLRHHDPLIDQITTQTKRHLNKSSRRRDKKKKKREITSLTFPLRISRKAITDLLRLQIPWLNLNNTSTIYSRSWSAPSHAVPLEFEEQERD